MYNDSNEVAKRLYKALKEDPELINRMVISLRVKLKDIEFKYKNGEFNIMMNMNELVDSLSRLGKSGLNNLIRLCEKKLKQIEKLK